MLQDFKNQKKSWL